MEIMGGTVKEFAPYHRSEFDKWTTFAKSTGITQYCVPLDPIAYRSLWRRLKCISIYSAKSPCREPVE
jgi:hypothetical protein